MKHIYDCTTLNNEHTEVIYGQIYSENSPEQQLVIERFKLNFELRKISETISEQNEDPNHVSHLAPLSSLLEHSNG